MMNVVIAGKPVFQIALEVDHVDMLMQCAAVHYDHTVKASARSGGFLYAWANRATFYVMAPQDDGAPAEPFTVSATYSELDLALKALEIAGQVFIGSQAERTARRMRCLALAASFWRMLSLANEVSPTWRMEANV